MKIYEEEQITRVQSIPILYNNELEWGDYHPAPTVDVNTSTTL